MADAVVSVLLDNLLSLIESKGSQLLEFDDQFGETKNELKYMQSYLKDVDQVKRKERNEILKTVMSDLRELVYDAEDVITDCQLLFHKKHQECAPDFTVAGAVKGKAAAKEGTSGDFFHVGRGKAIYIN